MTSIVDTVSQTITDGYANLYGIANDAVASAEAAMVALSNVHFPTAPTLTLPSLPSAPVNPSFPAAPAAPTIPTPSNPTVPARPTYVAPTVSAGTAPTFDADEPTINIPAAPSPFTGSLEAAPAINTDINIPAPPSIHLPGAPTLRNVLLPVAPRIEIPEFKAIVPIAPTEMPAAPFSYNEPTFITSLDTKPYITSMLNGQTGLPPAVEQALFDRARAREDITAKKAVEEAFEDWSSRGFSMPGGEINRRVEVARQNNQNQANSLSRDILTKSWDLKVDALKFAVQQGIAYEAQRIDLFNAMAGRKLQAAELTARLAVEYFNARVALYNARIAQFNAQAAAYQTLLQESAQRIEIYKGELQAAQQVGQLNQQAVQIYAEQVQAQGAYIEAYKAQIDGIQAKISVDRAVIDRYRGIVDSFSAQVGAKSAEYAAYGERVRAESSKATVYQALASAYGERVRAYASGNEAVIATSRAQSDIQRLNMESYQAELARFRAQLESNTQLISQTAQVYDAQARIYSAAVGGVGEQVRANSAAYGTQASVYQSQATVAIEQARMTATLAEQSVGLSIEAQKGVAQVGAQLAAGALSALHLSSDLSARANYDVSTRLSVDYNVDGGAGTPPVIGG